MIEDIDNLYELISRSNEVMGHLHVWKTSSGGIGYDLFDKDTLDIIDGGEIDVEDDEEIKEEDMVDLAIREMYGTPEGITTSLIEEDPDLEELGYRGM